MYIVWHAPPPLPQAMSDLVKDTLEGTQKALRKEKAAGNAAMIDDAVSKMSEKERAKVGWHLCPSISLPADLCILSID